MLCTAVPEVDFYVGFSELLKPQPHTGNDLSRGTDLTRTHLHRHLHIQTADTQMRLYVLKRGVITHGEH